MTGYKIFLTRSREVAGLLAKLHKVGEDHIYSVHCAPLFYDERVPAVYHDCGYYCCILEYHDLDQPRYETEFA